MLLGRDREARVIRDLAGEARPGHGAALVVIGDPGIGKTALADLARQIAGERGAGGAVRDRDTRRVPAAVRRAGISFSGR